jgi:rod shape-determining protein MreD
MVRNGFYFNGGYQLMFPLIFIPLVYVAVVVQTWYAPRWEVLDATPNLLALVAFVWLTQLPSRRGILMAALAGLISDLNVSTPPGLGMGIFACVAYGTVWIRQRISLDGFVAQLATVWFAAASVTLLHGLFIKFSGVGAVPWNLLVQRSAMVALYTMIVAIPFLTFVFWRTNPRKQFI